MRNGEEVTEYAARTVDGVVEVRSIQDEDPKYPAAEWARDQQALGARVQWRRTAILDDWSDLPGPDGIG